MSSFGAWSVKGIDDRARAAAKEQARLKGVTLGDYINDLLLQSGQRPEASAETPPVEDAGVDPVSFAQTPVEPAPRRENTAPIDTLARRIEAAEARSTLAITGIDQSVLGLLARIESSENNSSAMAAEVEGMIDELRETHETLQTKVRALEHDDTAEKNLQTMKTLEQALAQLASHVHEESTLAQEENAAIKGRVEAGFTDFNDRVEQIEGRIESRLGEATERVQKVVEQAELRAEGTSRHLSERFSAVEASVATRLAKVDDIASRMGTLESEVTDKVRALEDTIEISNRGQYEVSTRLNKVEENVADAIEEIEKVRESEATIAPQIDSRLTQIEDEVIGAVDALERGLETSQRAGEDIAARVGVIEQDVSGAITTMEETLLRIQDRLNRAETTTDSALKALEETFATLDQRIEGVASTADPELAEELRESFERKFEGLATELRANVEKSRQQLAEEIERAAQRIGPDLVYRLEGQVETMQTQIVEGNDRSAEAINAIGEQVNTLATGLDQRIQELEERDDSALVEQVSERLTDFTSTFEQRIADSEKRSASAIEQVGQQVATAIQRVKVRQGTQQKELIDAINTTKQAQDARLSKALSNISDRLVKMQASTAASVSPVQKAIVSLASRLEAVEDFTTPPHAQRPSSELPKMPRLKPDASNFDQSFEPEEAPIELKTYEPETELAEAQDDFYAGAPDYDGVDTEPEEAASYDEELDLAVETGDTGVPAGPTADDAQASLDDFLVRTPEQEDPLSDFDTWEEEQYEDEGEIETAVQAEPDYESEYDEDTDYAEETDFAEETEFADETDSVEDDVDLPRDNSPKTTTDYLNRARRAAMAAAADSDTSPPKRGLRGGKVSMPDLDVGLGLLNRGSKKKVKSKLPVVAAASVLAVSAAGAGGYVFLRGKQAIDPPTALTKAEFLGSSAISTAEPSALLANFMPAANPTEPVLEGALESQAVDADLFEDAAATLEAPAIVAAPPVAEPVAPQPAAPKLQQIPEMLSLKQAADAGNPVAEYQFAESRLAEQNYTMGVPYIRRAAEAGLPIAQYRLAKLLEGGLGVEKDMAASRVWTERAAEGGNVKAMHDLAVFYADGEGGAQSYAAAIDWFRQAAEFGLVDSQFNLGVMYENGLGISADRVAALYWFEIAAKNGDESALENIELLRESLPAASLTEIPIRVQNWAAARSAPAANGDFGAQPWEAGTAAQVRAVQAALNAFGYPAGTPDGIVGPGTRQAVRNFQLAEGIPVDGIIDKTLIETLNGKIAEQG